MSYLDISASPVPAGKRDALAAHMRAVTPLLKEYGALDVAQHWGTDVPDGTKTDLKRAVALAEGEIVSFGWIVWPDRATRDAAWGKIMQDPRFMQLEPPFDGPRMIFGGFEPVDEG